MIKTNSYTPFVNGIWSVHAILQKKKNIRKFCKYCNLKTNSMPFSVHKELQFLWEMKFLKQTTYVSYVITKLSKSVQINKRTSSDSFIKRILWKLKGPGTSFQTTFFTKFFDKKFSSVILHKLIKFHYQTVFTSQAIK